MTYFYHTASYHQLFLWKMYTVPKEHTLDSQVRSPNQELEMKQPIKGKPLQWNVHWKWHNLSLNLRKLYAIRLYANFTNPLTWDAKEILQISANTQLQYIIRYISAFLMTKYPWI